MIKAECDRCGKQAETLNGTVKMAVGLLSRVEVPLPKDWRRVEVPALEPEEVAERKELCPGCVNALRAFFEGDGAVPGLLEPETLKALQDMPVHPEAQDPRPNLTARAERVASGNIPVGTTTAPCPNAGDGLCDGRYRRGELHEHMLTEHGVRVSKRSVQCPYCVEIQPRSNVGAHIASAHPGDWQAWNDGGQHVD